MRVLVIGSGIAGLSIARDLCLRGESILLIDKGELAKGTTVNCAGMLHSGARYLVSDLNVANLCYQENQNMRKIAKHCIGKEEGLFTVLSNDTSEYSQLFEKNSELTGIPIKYINKDELQEYENNLNKNVSGGFLTADYIVDTKLLTACYIQDLKDRNVILKNNTTINASQYGNNKWIVNFSDGTNDSFDYVVNATGQDSDAVASIFNQKFTLEKIYGSMFKFKRNLTNRIVTRAAKNSAGDVLVPLSDGTLIGSTWSDKTKEEAEMGIDLVINTAKEFVNNIQRKDLVEIWTGVRTHEKASNIVGSEFGNVKRDFSIISNFDTSPKFLTVLPGKLTIARYVAFLSAQIIYNNKDIEDITMNYPLPKVELSNFFKI
ncbi:MAG TPA: FAD-dependent oxidoreductase [Candidatus Dojkabacteria bacterium]|nr:FAD-dependent oxidoreductase [Candidatus Dojkabacteria bacterium]